MLQIRFPAVRVLAIIAIPLLAGCGLQSPQEVMDRAETTKTITVGAGVEDAFHNAVKSRYATNKHVQHSLNRESGEGLIWMGGFEDVYAVVKFERLSVRKTRVTTFYHGGAWDWNLEGIRKSLKEKYGQVSP